MQFDLFSKETPTVMAANNKTIQTTHIDNCSHGYLSVSKKDFLKAGCDPKKITNYSGHTFTRLYLEEDQDMGYFIQTARENGYTVDVKNGYNESFAIHHNYCPELFNYIPVIGDLIDDKYTVTSVSEKQIIIYENNNTTQRRPYRIPTSNPFKHIHSVKKAS